MIEDTADLSDPQTALARALSDSGVQASARVLRELGEQPTLVQMLRFGLALADASGDQDQARRLLAEVEGYEAVGLEVPPERKVVGFASPFPVRAIGFLDPEEIFLANREKFSQVTLTIGQAIEELETALAQIEQGGVLALKVPASEVSSGAITVDEDSEVFIYILPREIERVVQYARRLALNTLIFRLVEGALGPGESEGSANTLPVPEPAEP